jgi:hypothetical protein
VSVATTLTVCCVAHTRGPIVISIDGKVVGCKGYSCAPNQAPQSPFFYGNYDDQDDFEFVLNIDQQTSSPVRLHEYDSVSVC